MQPPVGFVNTLALLDPLLNVRWGECAGKWVVERKAVTPVTELQWLRRRREREYARARRGEKMQTDVTHLNEEIVSLERGYRVICIESALTTQLYNNLCLTDITSYGGYSRYADEVEREEAEAKRKQDAAFSALLDDMLKESFGTGNGDVNIHSFLTSKKRAGALKQLQDGTRTLHEVLGVPAGQPLIAGVS